MIAKKMFKILGYEYADNNALISYDNPSLNIITFDLKYKTYYTQLDISEHMDISPSVHKAITQQMKELGWLD